MRNRRADATRGPRHQCGTPGQRLLPIHGDRLCGSHAHHLPRYICRARRQQEPQRRRRYVLGALGHVDKLCRATTPDLLAKRARHPLQRALGDSSLRCLAIFRRAASDHHAPAAANSTHTVVEHVVQRVEVFGCLDAGRIEDDAADAVKRIAFLAGGCNKAPGDLPVPVGCAEPFGVAFMKARGHADFSKQCGQCFAHRAARCRTYEERTDELRLPFLIPAQRYWLRQAKVGRQPFAESGTDEIEVLVLHRCCCLVLCHAVRLRGVRQFARRRAHPCGAVDRPTG